MYACYFFLFLSRCFNTYSNLFCNIIYVYARIYTVFLCISVYIYFCSYMESPSATLLVDPALPSWNLDTHLTYKKKTAPSRWFCMQFSLSIRFTPVGHQEKRSRNFSSFSSAFFEPKGVEELNSKGCFWNWLSSKVWQRVWKKRVYQCILSESITIDILLMDRSSFWWVFSLMWYDAESVLHFGRTKRHFWNPNRKQEPCVVINSEWIFVGPSIHRGVVNEISKGRIFSYCVSTSYFLGSIGEGWCKNNSSGNHRTKCFFGVEAPLMQHTNM